MIVFLILVAAAILGAGGVLTMLEASRIEAAHPASGRFVNVDGGRLHVLELGPSSGREEQPPVVMVHGASGNLNDLRVALGDRLAGNRRVILVDRPGHGWSDRPGGAADASPARQAALIMEALERMGIERFVLLGHSLGGAVASALALAWPERLAGLVLLAPVTHPWKGSIDWYNVILSTPVIGRLFAHTIAVPLSFLMLEGGVASVFAPQPAPADYVRRAGIRLLLRPAQFIANAQDIAALKAFVTAQAPRYAEIGVPTVILTGTNDSTVAPHLHARAFAEAVPEARLVMLTGIGHMPHHVSTDRVVAAVEQLSVGAVTEPTN
ncbi:MAG: alpha/beta hydrolase [Bradyrhizobiaceae bacterium]|nr:alpha/beta hydrolase [Bradyrhizobiaceae bacterium]